MRVLDIMVSIHFMRDLSFVLCNENYWCDCIWRLILYFFAVMNYATGPNAVWILKNGFAQTGIQLVFVNFDKD